jgi:Na+/phosphate symporter
MFTALADMLGLKTAQTVMLLHRLMNMIDCMMALFYFSATDARINTIYDTA